MRRPGDTVTGTSTPTGATLWTKKDSPSIGTSSCWLRSGPLYAMTSHTSESYSNKWINNEKLYARNESECTNCASRLSALASVMTWEQVINHLITLAQGELFCDMENSFWDIEVTQHLLIFAKFLTFLSSPGVSDWVGVADAPHPGGPG